MAKSAGQWRFPFGRPVLGCVPVATSARDVFVLGAYPSALHVAWQPPGRLRPVRAIAVDNEPEPFWTGEDADARVAAWRQAVGFVEGEWGTVRLPPGLNGPSGAWVAREVLQPLGVGRAQAWITDCLDTYRCSVPLARRLDDTYAPFVAALRRRGAALEPASLEPHPSESEIVREGTSAPQRERLLDELATARPRLVVTLGNAALRVFRHLAEQVSDGVPRRLTTRDYGLRRAATVRGRAVEWLPLAHPAAPQVYQAAHAAWVRRPR